LQAEQYLATLEVPNLIKMRFRQLLLLLHLLPAISCSLSAHAQKRPSHQLSIINENDNYAFTYTDRYYTNGMMVRYVQASKPKEDKPGRLFFAELGHQIFTPYKFSLAYRRYMDRPFTGFFYLKALQTRVLQNGALLQLGGLVGTIGEKAFGKEVQRWHHHNFGLRFPYGWERGLKTGVGLNAEARYVHPLLQLGSSRLGMHLHSSAQAQVGNLFVQGSTGMLLRVGALQPAGQSAAYDARMLANKKATEWYLFYEPQLIVQGYNATLQGTLWQHVDNVYTTSPRTLVCQQRVGVVFAPHRWTAQAAFAHKSKEATTMRANENWGTVAVAYRW